MASLGTWPTSLDVKAARLMMQTNQRVNASPGGGSEQAVDMLNDRWVMYVTLPIERFAEAQTVEAFLNSFRGQVNTVNAWHFARPTPNGTMRGSLVTIGTTAQGAASMQMQAQLGRINQLTKSEQFDDAAWTKSNATVTANATTDPLGGSTADKLEETATTNFHSAGQTGISSGAGRWSVYFKAAERTFAVAGLAGKTAISINLTTGATNVIAGTPTNVTATNAGGGWWRLSFDYASAAMFQVFPATSATTYSYAGTAGSGVYVWGADSRSDTDAARSDIPTYQRVNTSSDYDNVDTTQASKTLKAGDMIGAGGMLFQVAADATADATATITVSLVNRVRTAISAGAAVTWNAPTAAFRLLSHSGVAYSGALSEEVTVTLGEAI